MIDVLLVMFDWMPAGVKTLFLAALVLCMLPLFINIVLKIITLFLRR